MSLYSAQPFLSKINFCSRFISSVPFVFKTLQLHKIVILKYAGYVLLLPFQHSYRLDGLNSFEPVDYACI